MQRILTLNLLWRLEWLLQEEKMGDIADISILRRLIKAHKRNKNIIAHWLSYTRKTISG